MRPQAAKQFQCLNLTKTIYYPREALAQAKGLNFMHFLVPKRRATSTRRKGGGRAKAHQEKMHLH
jgi:hypothetical protein